MKNLFEDFKTTIYSEFDFLRNFGFANFTEEQIAHEYHIIGKSNNNITIDFQIEMISSTPIWITINGISLEKIFESQSVFENDKIERNDLYNSNFDNFLSTNDTKYLKKNHELFLEKGFLLNTNYLKQIKSLLIENTEFLLNPSIYENLREKINAKAQIALEEYYKSFEKLFDKNNQIIINEEILKSKLTDNLMIIETDKISIEINSFEEYNNFLSSLYEMKVINENVIYKFEPK